MAEIKSTLDLVMERTRNLSMTEEEKKEQQEKNTRKKITGLIQKYTDGLIKNEEFATEINKLSDTTGMDCIKAAITQIADMVTLGEDNLKLLDLLENVLNKNITQIVEVMDGYDKKLRKAAELRSTIILEDLRKTKGVSGTAVIPNLMTDTDFQKEISTIYKKTNAEISDLISDLTKAL